MISIIEIRIEEFRKDLDKLAKDYEDVADKKRRESNPQEANNLQLQLDGITKEMEDIEKKINKLIQKSTVNDNIQDLLYSLLTIENCNTINIKVCLKNVYQACCPDNWLYPVPDSLEDMLAELKNIPKGNSRYTAIEKFIARLILHNEIPEEVSQRLKTWAKNNIDDYSELSSLIANQIKKNDEKPYLIIVLRRSEQDSLINNNQEDYYFVDAWLISSGDNDNCQNKSETKQLSSSQKTENSEEGDIKDKETFAFKQIPQVIVNLLNQIGEYSSDRLTIEVFLPLDLINEAIDSWEVEDDFGFPVKLSSQYKIIIRSTERLLPTYSRYQGFWQAKWNTLQKIITNSVLSAFLLWNDDDLKRLFVELRKENIIGIQLQKSPVQTGKGSVFAVILSTATPIALWLRCHLPQDCDRQINALLECCIEQLTETVTQKRLEALPEPEDSHIGHHISLLWEDPYRLPPSIDYSM